MREEKGEETSIRVFENSDLPIEFNAKTNFIGNLKKGDIGSAIFNFEVDSNANAKNYIIKIQVRTLNNDNVIVCSLFIFCSNALLYSYLLQDQCLLFLILETVILETPYSVAISLWFNLSSDKWCFISLSSSSVKFVL